MPDDPAACGSTYQYPYGPPVDSNGKVIGDIPWKFFEPDTPATRRVAEKMRPGQPAGHDRRDSPGGV